MKARQQPNGKADNRKHGKEGPQAGEKTENGETEVVTSVGKKFSKASDSRHWWSHR